MGEKGKRQRGLSVIHRLFLHLAGDDGADLLCIMGMCTMGTLATSSLCRRPWRSVSVPFVRGRILDHPPPPSRCAIGL